jgi:hypothetical protein
VADPTAEPDAGAAEADPAGRRIEQARGAINRLKLLMDHVHRRDEDQVAQTAAAFADHVRAALGGSMLELRVNGDGIFLDETELTGGDVVGRAMLEGLVGEGLEALIVLPSVSNEELTDLADMLTQDWRNRTSEEAGLEAESWRRGFSHVFLDLRARRVVTELDGDVEDEEMVARLFRQLGVQTVEDADGGLDAEIGAVLRHMRSLGDGALDEPTLEAMRATASHRGFLRELEAVSKDQDVSADTVGLIMFETLRCAPDGDHAADTVAAFSPHMKAALRRGDLDLAGAVIRRLGVLAQPDLFDGWAAAAGATSAMSQLLDDETAQAIAVGVQLNPDIKSWSGVLFSLGQLAAVDDLDGVLVLGRHVADRALRQALGDALLMVVQRSDQNLRAVLNGAADVDLPVVLLALGRQPDPTLVEQILARESSEDAQVREAVLIALRAHQSPRIKAVMRAALEDPAAPVRMEALRYLSVYRDAEAAGKVERRLTTVLAREADEAELRALAIAMAIMTRGAGIEALEQLAAGVSSSKHPAAPRAALHGLRAGGRAGRAALERVGRSQPALRDEIRGLLGGMG